MVSRTSIEHILNEQRFQYSGLTKSRVIELGRLAGAKSVLVGQVNEYKDNKVSFQCKLLKVETGAVVFSALSRVDFIVNRPLDMIATALIHDTVNKMGGP